MATRSWRMVILAGVAALVSQAQDGSVSGPSAGYVFDGSTSALRRILGVPGASVLGAPLKVDLDLTGATVAPGQDSALAAAAAGGLHYLRLTAEGAAERTIDGLAAEAERVVFSPQGKAAALYAAGRVQLLSGLPDFPVVAGRLDLEGTPSALAVSDDGSYLLYVSAGAIRILGLGGDNRKLMEAGEATVVAFAPGQRDAAIMDSGSGVLLFRDLAGSAQQSIVASADDSLGSPVGLAFSRDGRRLFLASAGARSVATFDLQSGERSVVGCNCSPTGLVSMGGLFRLSDPGASPVWLFDATATEPRIVFVPVPSAQ